MSINHIALIEDQLKQRDHQLLTTIREQLEGLDPLQQEVAQQLIQKPFTDLQPILEIMQLAQERQDIRSLRPHQASDPTEDYPESEHTLSGGRQYTWLTLWLDELQGTEPTFADCIPYKQCRNCGQSFYHKKSQRFCNTGCWSEFKNWKDALRAEGKKKTEHDRLQYYWLKVYERYRNHKPLYPLKSVLAAAIQTSKFLLKSSPQTYSTYQVTLWLLRIYKKRHQFPERLNPKAIEEIWFPQHILLQAIFSFEV